MKRIQVTFPWGPRKMFVRVYMRRHSHTNTWYKIAYTDGFSYKAKAIILFLLPGNTLGRCNDGFEFDVTGLDEKFLRVVKMFPATRYGIWKKIWYRLDRQEDKKFIEEFMPDLIAESLSNLEDIYGSSCR